MSFSCDICNREFSTKLGKSIHRRFHEPGQREKYGAASKRVHADLEIEARRVQAIRNAYKRPEVRARRSEIAREIGAKSEYKAKLSRASRAVLARPEVKAKLSKSLIEACKRPEVIESRRRGQQAPGVNEARVAKIKATVTKLEVKQRICKAMKASHSRPEVRQKIREATRRLWAAGEIGFASRKKGYFQSKKGGNARFRSSWEKHFYELLDDRDDVVSFKSEPFYIEYEFEGNTHDYYPDALVEFSTSDHVLVEVKPAAHVSWPKNVAKRLAAESYCKANGLRYEIWTEKELGL